MLRILDIWSQIASKLWRAHSTNRTATGAHTDITRKQLNPILCTDDPPTIIRVYREPNHQSAIFIDSRNYWPADMSELSSATGTPMQGSIDPASDSAVYRRLALSCSEVIESALLRYIKFVADNDLGMFRWTVPSQSMAAYRHKFLKHKILVHQEPELRALERSGYFGGQTECYRLGVITEPMHKLDVTSMYPSVMSEREFPIERIAMIDAEKNQVRTCPVTDPGSAIADVTIAADRRTYPVRRDGRLMFAIGTYRTTLPGPELADACARGDVILWHRWCEYKLAPIFTEYVEKMWSLRQEYAEMGDLWLSNCCKWMMNSLYGKFGQRLPKWTELVGKKCATQWGKYYVNNRRTGEITTLRAIAGVPHRLDGFTEHPAALPSIAAFITSWGRQKMHYLREIAGQNNCAYQVCDSLLVNSAGYERLRGLCSTDRPELGKLRYQATYREIDILGPNHIRLDNKWITAGISARVIAHDGTTWTSEIDDRIDSHLDREPRDVQNTRVRVSSLSPYKIYGQILEPGPVLPPVLHMSKWQ
jgi:hypothetical protein